MKKLRGLSLAILLITILSLGCQKNIFEDDNPSDGGNGTVEASWNLVSLETERLIKNVFATPFQLYLITDNEFVRLNEENELVEKRTLIPQGVALSRPVMDDNVFVRLSSNSQSQQFLEFHLARNPSGTIKFNIEDLRSEADDHFEIEFLQRNLGVFNENGTQFLLPVKVFQNGEGFAAFYLFDIEFNASFDEFISIEFGQRLEEPTLVADASNITNIVNVRFFDGNYFISTKKGAYKITADGDIGRIFPQWMLDFFQWEGKLYVTGLNSFDMHVSEDGGEEWERLNQNSELQMVEVKGGKVFAQEVLGKAFKCSGADLQNLSNIVYHEDIPADNPSAFYGLAYFKERYYFSVDRTIYYTEEIKTE